MSFRFSFRFSLSFCVCVSVRGAFAEAEGNLTTVNGARGKASKP